MSDRQHIGLDNPAFRGRLRQPSGQAQLLHAQQKQLQQQPVLRPSARHFNDFSVVTSQSSGRSAAQPIIKQTPITPAVAAKPAVTIPPQPVQSVAQPSKPSAVTAQTFIKPKTVVRSVAPVVQDFKPTSSLLGTKSAAKPTPHLVSELARQPYLSFHNQTAASAKSVATSQSTSKSAQVPPVAKPLHQQRRQPSTVLRRQSSVAAVDSKELLPAGRINRLRVKVARSIQQYSKPQLALMSMGIFIFLVGLSVSLLTLRTNHSANQQVAALSRNSETEAATTDATGTTSNGHGGAAAPSTVRPSSSAVNNYAVGPTMARYLNIPKLGVHARVLSLGILNSGALATPNNVFDAGWYNESSLPGQPGVTLLDGHVSSWTSHGVFYGIKNLNAGDQISIERGDGQVINYQVVKHDVFSKDNVDMKAALTPIDPSVSGLNLITCTGQVIHGTNEFSERVLVYAKQVK